MEQPHEMEWIELLAFLGSRTILAFVLTWILKSLTKILLPFSVPDFWLFILCGFYSVQIKNLRMKPFNSELPISESSKPESIPLFVQLEPEAGLPKVKEELDTAEELLQAYSSLIDESEIVCRDTFTEIQKEQKEQLRQYNDFRTQYVDQFGSIVNVLEGHRKDIAETSRVAREQNSSLGNIIGQYKQIVDNNQRLTAVHIESVTEAFKAQDKAITRNRELADERDESIQNSLRNQWQLIGDNTELIRKHGISIDNVVSDHANLAAEYQKALDGLALLITANRIFSSIHEASDWENLQGHARHVDADRFLVEGTEQETQEPEKLIKEPDWGIASASVIENVQQIALAFRDSEGEKTKAAQRNSDETDQRASRKNKTKKTEYPGWEPVSGVDQLMATMFDQLKATLQRKVEARHAEEMRQLRLGREDMEKLRAEIGDVQELRQQVRELQAQREMVTQKDEEIKALREEIRRIRSEVRQQVRDEMDQQLAEIKNTTIAATNLKTCTCANSVAATTISDPVEVTHPGPVPAVARTDNDDADAVNTWNDEADDAADEATDNEANSPDDGRLLGDFLGRLLGREEWPDKKRSRRKTRKMYAIAKQRAEQQVEE